MVVSAISESRSAGTERIRVLTYNIFGRSAGWDNRRRVLAAGLRDLRPDVVAFQESVLVAGYDQAADLLGSDYQIVQSRARETDGSGVALGSRWPIRAVRELDLTTVSARTGDFACTTLIAEIEAPPPLGRLLIANHFPDYQVDHEIERERQTAIAARALENMVAASPAHVVLMGDLDAEPDAASLRFLTGKQSLEGLSVCYRNAWDAAHPGEAGHTFTPVNPLVPAYWPFRRIDHVLVRCGPDGFPTLRIVACGLAFAAPIEGTWASDHFALVADLAPPDR